MNSAKSGESSTRVQRTTAYKAGAILSSLIGLLLLLDALAKLFSARSQVAMLGQIGISASAVPVIGAMLLVSLALYAIPRTVVFGAVLITAYLGGAVCANIISKAPVGLLLAPIIVAVPVWLGFYLRSPLLRQIARSGH